MQPYTTLAPEGKIPLQLQRLPRWCRWKLFQNQDGKRTKRPVIATNDHARWLPYAAVEKDTLWSESGIGFCCHGGVTGALPNGSTAHLVFLDLDACRCPVTGTLSPWAVEAIGCTKATYTEVTPSGTGIRIALWVVNLPAHLRKVHPPVEPAPGAAGKRPEIQTFVSSGYVTVTGQRLDGTAEEPLVLADIDALIERHHMRDDSLRGNGHPVLPTGTGAPPSFEEITEAILALKHGKALIAADWQAVWPEKSASEAFHRLACEVLLAARGHGQTAVEWLLACTSWGLGEVEGSAEPEKYARRRWVEADVARAAGKAGAPPVTEFEILREGNTGSIAGDASTTATSTTAIAEGNTKPAGYTKLELGLLSREPPVRDYLLRYASEIGLGEGFAPSGIPAFLTAEGGVGKTMIELQLAVSVITGRPWLGFQVDPDRVGQRVMLVLAEETHDEVWRRLWDIAQDMGLTEPERRLVEEQLTVLPLAGQASALATIDRDGVPHGTPLGRELVALLEASQEPWALVVIDPLARTFPGAEADNVAATYCVQSVERLCRAPGRPLVLFSHHSSKQARRAGGVDVRGVTGLFDAVRMVWSLRAVGKGRVEFAQDKANYAGEMDGALKLRRSKTGVLRAPTVSEVKAETEAETKAEVEAERDQAVADMHAVVEALSKLPNGVKNRDDLIPYLGWRAVRVRAGFKMGLTEGLIVRDRDRVYRDASGRSGSEEGV